MKMVSASALVATLTLLQGCSHLLVNQFAFHPQKVDASVPTMTASSVDEVQIRTEDGETLQAFFYPRPRTRCALLYLHGNAGNAYSRMPAASTIAKTGCNVLLLSYRGYGKSTGVPTEEGVYLDAAAAFDYLFKQGFRSTQIFVFGRSLGTAVAIHIAQRRSVAGLILLSPFSSGRDVARAQGLDTLLSAVGHPFNSVVKVAAVNAPLLVVHGDRDRVIPVELGQKVYAAHPGPKYMQTVPGAGHNNLIQVFGADFWRLLRQFLQDPVGLAKR